MAVFLRGCAPAQVSAWLCCEMCIRDRAAVSLPDYDLASWRQNYAALATAQGAPLVNRVLNGQYAPGSAFKPAVAASALAAGIITPQSTVNCGGRYTYYAGYQPRCLQLGHRGAVSKMCIRDRAHQSRRRGVGRDYQIHRPEGAAGEDAGDGAAGKPVRRKRIRSARGGRLCRWDPAARGVRAAFSGLQSRSLQ